MVQPSGFDDKLLARLGKLDPDQVQAYLARLLAQRQFLQTIFDHLDEGIIVTNAQLAIFFANRKARQMLGWPRDKNPMGEDLGERLAKDHPLRDVVDSLRGRLRAIEGYEIAWGPRDSRTLSVSTLPMRTPPAGEREEAPAAEDDLLIILLHDVTERHRRQSEQARARRLTSLATLTSGIAHEIKNPLNSLNIHAQLLRGEAREAAAQGRAPDLAKTTRASEVIIEECARLRHIVEQFIQAARPGPGRFEMRELRPLLEDLERIFRPECEQSGIVFAVALDPELPPLPIDEHQLLQALRNLLRNAIEALQERSQRAREAGEEYEPQLELDARLEGDHVLLIVGDNGPGIGEEALEHIFEPYFTTKFSGSGLGLMIVYRIVSEHRGALHVDTRPGEGTRFIISLPLVKRPIRLLGYQAPAAPTIIRDKGRG